MQSITRCINRCKNLKSSKLIGRSYITKTSKINSANNVITRFPIATKLSDQRKFTISYNARFVSGYSTSTTPEIQPVDSLKFEKVCEETLESLSEYFEELIEDSDHLKLADVSYSSGVLTINFGEAYGTYVINRQSPNKQIWLSSPTSGPKRYDFIADGEYWLYKHDGRTLHELLQSEISKIIRNEVDFSKCLYSR
ncbi:hypothetical protein AMK59_4180, partial [Oryctes borbonicus]